MKGGLKRSGVLLAGCAAALVAALPLSEPAAAAAGPGVAASRGVQVGVSFFYDELAPWGEWIWLDGPGWVWYPHDVRHDWRPYVMGRWVYTDFGWTWVSEEEWGWAVYHYGRWLYDPFYGWVWAPGTVWGPAWVAWHWGGGWIGWAPLPWRVGWRGGVGLELGHVDLDVVLEPTWWCFVETRYILEPRVRHRVVPAARNVTLIRRTKNVTRYTVVENRVVNRGVGVEIFEKEIGSPVPRYRVRDVDSIRVSRGGKVKGDEVVLFRPAVSKRRGQREPAGRPEAAPGAHPRAARPEVAPPGSGPRGEAGPAPADVRRREKRNKELEAYHAAEQEELERIHREEISTPPPSASQDEITRRQDAEHRALELKQQRERQVQEQRQRREPSERTRPAPERQARPAPGPPAQPEAEPAAKPKPESSAKPKAEKAKPGKPGGD
jgi:hypothetical protein